MMNGTAQIADHFDAVAARWARAARTLDALNPLLVSRLGAPAPGTTLLDVACGAGEPGLSVAEAHPGVRLVGVDISPAMVDQARLEARRREVTGARFAVGSAEELDIDDDAVDAVVSRMGLFGFPGASIRSAQEAFRVLRPGGRLAVAVWDRAEGNTFARAVVAALASVAGPGAFDLSWQEELADGRRERWLRDAGFADVVSEPVSWTMPFAGADALWERANDLGPLASAFAARDDADRAAARGHLVAALAEHRGADGSYAVPVSGRIITAVEPGNAASA